MGSDLVKFVSAGIRQRLESRDIDFDCRIRNRQGPPGTRGRGRGRRSRRSWRSWSATP
ncbi:MAG: hypothetical protein M0C28_25505 [Candidatus Moduliflexus flocculans]|nr:hypothetical protein [Candidatus Moduliflexus flocculans]